MAEQHVEIERKLLLRRRLLRLAADGAAYVPFIGDGDIADKLYRDRLIFGADIDQKRVDVAKARLPFNHIIKGDCDSWPFAGYGLTAFAVGDFDAYAYPYDSFRAFWEVAPKASPLVLFFTDAQRQTMKRGYKAHLPDGSWWETERPGFYYTSGHTGTPEFRRMYNFYFKQAVLPWFQAHIAPWKLKTHLQYTRGAQMIYWGALVERGDHDEVPATSRSSRAGPQRLRRAVEGERRSRPIPVPSR